MQVNSFHQTSTATVDSIQLIQYKLNVSRIGSKFYVMFGFKYCYKCKSNYNKK